MKNLITLIFIIASINSFAFNFDLSFKTQPKDTIPPFSQIVLQLKDSTNKKTKITKAYSENNSFRIETKNITSVKISISLYYSFEFKNVNKLIQGTNTLEIKGLELVSILTKKLPKGATCAMHVASKKETPKELFVTINNKKYTLKRDYSNALYYLE